MACMASPPMRPMPMPAARAAMPAPMAAKPKCALAASRRTVRNMLLGFVVVLGSMMLVRPLDGGTEVHGRQEGEDKSLDEGHEQLEHRHEDGEEQREDRYAPTQTGVDLTEDEDQGEEAQYDDVA